MGNAGKQEWILGEDLGWADLIRSMSNPNAFGQPDTYLGTNWVNTVGCTPSSGNDYCGVHTNSGVLNFWFFLYRLAEQVPMISAATILSMGSVLPLRQR